MFEVIRKICRTGIVTRKLKSNEAPERYRGKLIAQMNKCDHCGACAIACPTKAIKVFPNRIDNKVLISYERCIFCGVCAQACKNQALKMSNDYHPAIKKEQEETIELQKRIKKPKNIFGKSLHIRHVDSGSCNGCDFEMNALTNPIYDIQRFGIDFVASPRHADLLMVTGGVTRHLEEAVRKTFNAAANPRMVVAVGTCACGGGIFGANYAGNAGVDKIVPVFMYLPGCPPRPQAMIEGILTIMEQNF